MINITIETQILRFNRFNKIILPINATKLMDLKPIIKNQDCLCMLKGWFYSDSNNFDYIWWKIKFISTTKMAREKNWLLVNWKKKINKMNFDSRD